MKTIKILNIVINFSFALYRVKRVTIDLQSDADDVSVSCLDTINGAYMVKYYKGSQKYLIPLPYCRKAVQVRITPMYTFVCDKKQYSTNRKIVVDVYR